MELGAPESSSQELVTLNDEDADPLSDTAPSNLDRSEFPGLPKVANCEGIFESERPKRGLSSPSKNQNDAKMLKKQTQSTRRSSKTQQK